MHVCYNTANISVSVPAVQSDFVLIRLQDAETIKLNSMIFKTKKSKSKNNLQKSEKF